MSYTDAVCLFRSFHPGARAPSFAFPAMYRSHMISGAFALAASFIVSFAAGAAPAHAAETLPDARILSSAPFIFQSDRDIFYRKSDEPSDSRIFQPIEPIRSAGESQLLQERSRRRPII